MRFLDSLRKIKFVPINANGGVIDISLFGNTSDFSNINTCEGQTIAYQTVKAVKTVINRRALTFVNGKVWVLDKDGNEANTSEANNARQILENPNPLQTWSEFYLQQKIYKYVFGYCPVYMLRPVGMKEVAALYNILPPIFSVEYTGRLYNQTKIEDIIKSYKLTYGGVESILPIDDIYISKDISQSLDISQLLPDSRLVSLQYEVALDKALGDAKFTMVKRRGALGILSNDTKDVAGPIPVSPEERKRVQEEYRKYGLSSTQNQIIITEANLRWQQMSISTRELMLLELGDDAVMKIADAYDYPYELLGNTKGVTFANKNEARKQFYQDTTIPEANSDSQALTKMLGLVNCHVDIDFSHISVLQEDKKQSADTLNTVVTSLNGALNVSAITIEEYRKKLSEVLDIDPDAVREETDTILAQVIGVGGTQSLVQILVDPNLSTYTKRGLLRELFNFSEERINNIIDENQPAQQPPVSEGQGGESQAAES